MKRATCLICILLVLALTLYTAVIALAENQPVKPSAASTERLVVLRDKWSSEREHYGSLFEINCDAGTNSWKETKLLDFPSEWIGSWQFYSLAPIFSSSKVVLGTTPGMGILNLYALIKGEKGLTPQGEYVTEFQTEAGPVNIESWTPNKDLLIIMEHGESEFPLLEVVKIGSDKQVTVGKKADATVAQAERVLRKDWKGFFTAAYSVDGSMLVAAAKNCLYICDRRTGEIKILRIPVNYLSALFIHPDNKLVAWIGGVGPRKDEEYGDEFLDISSPNAFGLTRLNRGKTTYWQTDKLKSMPKGYSIPSGARIAVSQDKKVIYFVLEESGMPKLGWWRHESILMRFDIEKETMEPIASGVTSFAVPYER